MYEKTIRNHRDGFPAVCLWYHRKQHSAKRNLANEERDTLSYEQRRKYNYFFLEAVRLKQKGDYDAAFELYKHCLDIYPGSAPACMRYLNFIWCWDRNRKVKKR